MRNQFADYHVLVGHLEKLLLDKKLDDEKRKEYQSVLNQVGGLDLPNWLLHNPLLFICELLYDGSFP